MEGPSLHPDPIFQCPACQTKTDKFPCPSCGRKLTGEEQEARDKLISAAGGLDSLKHIHRQAELNEWIEKSQPRCPSCGAKGEVFPCPACFHQLTDTEKEALEDRKMILRAAQEYKRMDAVNYDGIQFGKRMGTRDANGEFIDKGGCLLLLVSLAGFISALLLCHLIGI